MVGLLKFLLLLVIATLGASFAYINPGDVSISYYFGDLELPLGLLIFLLLGVGMAIGVLVSLAAYIRVQRENGSLRRRAQLAGEEIQNLRSLPLRDR